VETKVYVGSAVLAQWLLFINAAATGLFMHRRQQRAVRFIGCYLAGPSVMPHLDSATFSKTAGKAYSA